MARNADGLDVLHRARRLVDLVYRLTQGLEIGERLGLQSQARRAAVSIAANIAEGAARRSPREYARFVGISLGSASELQVLLDVIGNVCPVASSQVDECRTLNTHVLRSLQKLQSAIRRW